VDLNSVRTRGEGFVIGLGDATAAVAMVRAPIPWQQLEGPCATAWWWPEASKCMQGHAAHILVALVGEAGNPVQRHIALSCLAAAVASHTDAVGICWGGGRLVHEPKRFIEEAQNLSPESLPWPLWIDFRVEPGEDGTNRLFTTGMKAFGKMEIEIPGSRKGPAEVFDFALSIADYILTEHPQIESGHTVGRSADENIRATHAPSMLDPEMTVLRLEF